VTWLTIHHLFPIARTRRSGGNSHALVVSGGSPSPRVEAFWRGKVDFSRPAGSRRGFAGGAPPLRERGASSSATAASLILVGDSVVSSRTVPPRASASHRVAAAAGFRCVQAYTITQANSCAGFLLRRLFSSEKPVAEGMLNPLRAGCDLGELNLVMCV
jgi:hypothetical protein